MKNFSLILFLLVPVVAFSQIEIDRNDLYFINQKNPAFGKADSSVHILNFGIGFNLNSNSITNDFTKGLLYQGHISDAQKDQVTERLKNVNRAGYEFNTGFTYKYQYKPDLAIVVGLNEREQFNARYSRDMFELVFRGNKQFVGKKANLSPLSVNYFDYRSLYMGVQKKLNDKLIIGGGLSILRGGNFQSVKITRGTLYTDTAGAYLDFDMNFKLNFSDNKSFLNSSGAGAALNFNASLLQDKGQWNFEIRDLGMIKWNGLNSYEGNSVFRYDGVDANNVLSFNDSIFNQTKADSIASAFGITRKEKSINYLVPATFHLNYVYFFSDKLSVVAGTRYMINASYIPRIYVKGIYYFRKDLFIVPMLAYGGFGKMDVELGAAKSFKDKLIVSVNAFYLEYILLPKKSAGQGFNFSITKLF